MYEVWLESQHSVSTIISQLLSSLRNRTSNPLILRFMLRMFWVSMVNVLLSVVYIDIVTDQKPLLKLLLGTYVGPFKIIISQSHKIAHVLTASSFYNIFINVNGCYIQIMILGRLIDEIVPTSTNSSNKNI